MVKVANGSGNRAVFPIKEEKDGNKEDDTAGERGCGDEILTIPTITSGTYRAQRGGGILSREESWLRQRNGWARSSRTT